MYRTLIAAAAATLAMAGASTAQTRVGMTPSPPVGPDAGYDSIRAGRLAQAETALTAARKRHPGAPEVALNLAAVYVMTGRTGMAMPLYREVMDAEPIAMDMPSGNVVSSHDVAARAMTRMNAEYAAR